LHRRLRANEVMIQRFLREARLASRLDHPYAAHVYAFGVEKEDGLLWIAMEMVHGTTLDHWLRERGALPLAELVPFFERIAEVVQTAHERGIVHRDLKPSNVMVIQRAGRLLPKLLDLGIAKLRAEDSGQPETALARPRGVTPREVRADADTMTANHDAPTGIAVDSELTDAGAAVGSPPYMAPEQWLGGAVGPAADLYSLGVLAYEALAGRRPFTATNVAGYIELHARAAVPPLGAGFPPALDRFFSRALAKQPGDRPANALELAAALRVASGLAESPEELPKLDRGVHDAWISDAPQPLCELVAALEAGRNPHQARDAGRELLRGAVRYLLAIALASHAQVRDEREDRTLLELLRALRQRDLDDGERVRLLRQLVRPFAERRDTHPVPPLVDLVVPGPDGNDSLDAILRLDPSGELRSASDDVLRTQLARLVSELGRLLRACSFLLDYPLVVVRNGAPERWTGLTRRPRRALAVMRETSIADDQPLLIDREGRRSVLLWPLVQVLAPTPAADPELFVFDGRGRHGARLVAAPAGFERHDPSLWDWLAEHVLGSVEGERPAIADEAPPYLGLAPFTASDAERFVGREQEIDAFVNRLALDAFHVVVGASGAGKSSFVFAGVVPALRPGTQLVTTRPALAGGDDRDQRPRLARRGDRARCR
jgi:hypothetical protein